MRLRATATLGGTCALVVSCTLTSLDGLTGGARAPVDAGREAAVIADTGAPDTFHPAADAARDAAEASVPGAADASDAGRVPDADAGGCYLADGLIPAQPDFTDGVAYEMGTRVRPAQDVVATKMRYWKAPSELGGPHTGSIWAADGTHLASAVLPVGAASGWIEGAFMTPVPLAHGQDYVVTVLLTSHYTSSPDIFATNLVCPTGKLAAPMDTTAAHNGLFGPPGALPAQTYLGSFYFVDIYVE
jgi:hypothetical protein